MKRAEFMIFQTEESEQSFRLNVRCISGELRVGDLVSIRKSPVFEIKDIIMYNRSVFSVDDGLTATIVIPCWAGSYVLGTLAKFDRIKSCSGVDY